MESTGYTKDPRVEANLQQDCLSLRHHIPPHAHTTSAPPPFPVPHEHLASAGGKGFHTAPGTIGISIPQVAPGADQISCQQDKCTQKRRPHRCSPPPQAATPENNTNHLKISHQGTLISVAAASTRETPLASFPDIFTLIDIKTVTSPCFRINRLATLSLAYRPPLVVCVETPDPHTRVLWGVEYMMPQFLSSPTPKDGKVIAFTR